MWTNAREVRERCERGTDLNAALRKEKEAWTTKRRAGQKSENEVAEGDKKGKERAQ